MYAQRNEELSEAEGRFEIPPEVVGLIMVLRGRARCADVFDKPATLRAYWSWLVRSYALEAEKPGASSGTDLDSATRLLSRASRATRREFHSRGLGIDVRLSGSGITGAALVHQDVVARTAVFRQTGRLRDTTIRRPGEGARRLGL